MASVMGPGGQSNYAAANHFLDALVSHRRQHGLAGLSINWGAWSEIGVGVKMLDRIQQMKGMGVITPELGIRAFSESMTQERISQVAVMPMDWEALSAEQ